MELLNPYIYDCEQWIRKFPLDDVSDIYSALIGTSPRQLAHFEQYRRLLSTKYNFGEPVPTDVFALGLGEAQCRDITRIGGMPYRPAGISWPTTPNGKPMTFLMQYRFAESRDIVGHLPGDMLLIFVQPLPRLAGLGEPSPFLYEWYDLGLTSLISPAHVPEPTSIFVSAYGQRHRTYDFACKQCQDSVEALFAQQGDRKDSIPDGLLASLVCCTHTIKIGGVPVFLHPLSSADRQAHLPGRFLCGLTPVYPGDGPYPWLNVELPIEDTMLQIAATNSLNYCDGVAVYWSLTEDMRIHSLIQIT